VYPHLLGKCGKGVLFGRFVDLVHPKRISLGDRVILSNRVTLDASGYDGPNYAVSVENDVFIGIATHLNAKKNEIILQSGANVGSNCKIVANLPVNIGQNVLLAAYCVIGDTLNNDFASIPRNERQAVFAKATIVEKGSWLGVRVKMRSGALVRKESIVGAHSLVEGEIPAWAIAIGRPAKIVRFRHS
jgi:acetyltransferase-like isoleucine patch superfamily enzyme